MTTPLRNVYLGAVKAEFQSYVDELASNLTRRGFIVKTRDDFLDEEGNRLEKIEEFIRNCDTVISIIGSQFGEEPPAEESETFADISRSRHSYAQWEYLFGSHVGKSVYAFVPSDETPRDSRNHESTELAELQDHFSRTWIESGVNGPPIEFKNLVDLRVEALVLPELTPRAVDPQIERKLTLENPYPGFQKFTEENAHLFFGRDPLIRHLNGVVGANPLTTVFGKNGAGKSSVIRAGVIPTFLKQFPGKAIVFTPGENPFQNFSTALEQAGFPETLVEQARKPSPTSFRAIRKAAGNASQPWLIFIDQFEEIFTRPTKHNAPLVLQFVRALVDASSAKQQTPLRIVLAIRDDFLGRLSEFKDLAEVCDKTLVRVNQPDWVEMCQIIEMPAAKHGVRYESDLVSRIVSHTEGEGQTLPKLQYALHRLWEVEKKDLGQFAQGVNVSPEDEAMGGLHDRKINRSSYKAINGVPHALKTRIGELFAQLSITERRQLRKLLLNFMVVAESDAGLLPMAKPATQQELAGAGTDSERYIKTLLDEGILVPSEKGSDKLELAHESILHEWKDLADWSNDIRDAAELKRALHTDARIWHSRQNDRTDTFDDLWGGARLERARELNEVSDESGKTTFDRVGGLGDLENDFIKASADRFAKELRYDLGESAQQWRSNKKSKANLLTGTQLNRAMEMNQVQVGETASGFDRVGGLEKTDAKYLKASEKASHPKPTGLMAILGIALVLGLVSFFTPLDDVVVNSLFPEGHAISEFFKKLNGK